MLHQPPILKKYAPEECVEGQFRELCPGVVLGTSPRGDSPKFDPERAMKRTGKLGASENVS
jgi:hypothetical protein